MGNARALVGLAAERVLGRDRKAEARYAMLLNNLGAVSPLESAILLQALARTRLASRIALIIGRGSFVTSLDMNGFSLSLLELDAEREAGLLATATPRPGSGRGASECRSWLRNRRSPGRWRPGRRRIRGCALVEKAAAVLAAIEAEINALDAKVGDGDTGSTFAQAAAG